MTRKNINKTKKKISSKDVAYAAKSSAEIKNDTGSVSSSDANMKVLRYIVGRTRNALRELMLRRDPADGLKLVVSNIPPFMDENGVAVLITAASGINGKVTLKRSSAKDSDITKGYRSGIIYFSSTEECDEIWSRLDKMNEPLSMDGLGIKLIAPLGLKKYVRQYNSQFISSEELEEMTKNVSLNSKSGPSQAKRRKLEPDDEGWITVTKNGNAGM